MKTTRLYAVCAICAAAPLFNAAASDIYARVAGSGFAYFSDVECTTAVPNPPDSGVEGCVVLFGTDAEYQILAERTETIALADDILLQNDVSFSMDTDWSAFDFNLNGKTLSISDGAVLTLGGVTGSGTVQAPGSASGTLEWKIPAGVTYTNTGVSLVGENLLVRKTGAGKLVMSKTNDKFGSGSSSVSLIVAEGVVSKTDTNNATCGVQYSRIVVEDGAQFDICGRKYWDYDYEISGAGPDGKGALVKSNTESTDGRRAYTQAKDGFMRNIELKGSTTIYADMNGTAACDWALMFYNYKENKVVMNGNTLTIDGPAYSGDIGGRIYAGNTIFEGEGRIIVATNGCFETYDSSFTRSAPGCELHVYGMFWTQSPGATKKMSGVSPVKSLVFHESGLYRNLRPASPVATNLVYETYAPNMKTWPGNTTRRYPFVRLGDANHAATTLDLSRWTGVFDDSVEGSLSFAENTVVTVDLGNRVFGASVPIYKWGVNNEPPQSVVFTAKQSGSVKIVRDDAAGCLYAKGDGLRVRIK